MVDRNETVATSENGGVLGVDCTAGVPGGTSPASRPSPRHTCYDHPYDERSCPACQAEFAAEAMADEPPAQVQIDAELRRSASKIEREAYQSVPMPWESR